MESLRELRFNGFAMLTLAPSPSRLILTTPRIDVPRRPESLRSKLLAVDSLGDGDPLAERARAGGGAWDGSELDDE